MKFVICKAICVEVKGFLEMVLYRADDIGFNVNLGSPILISFRGMIGV